MTESETTPRRGRRARELSPEESAALEARAGMETTGEQVVRPGVRGAVAPPTADAAVPTLRKFGRRARIIELSEETPPEVAAGSASGAGEPASDETASDEPGADETASGEQGPAQPASREQPAAGHPSAEDGSASTMTRDHDGVELGELSVTEAPEPRPAPRFDGKVLHRPERAGGRALVLIVWALIAIALIVLIALLLSGVLGGSEASAAESALTDAFAVVTDHPAPVLEEIAA